jgi:hypothetical protein
MELHHTLHSMLCAILTLKTAMNEAGEPDHQKKLLFKLN